MIGFSDEIAATDLPKFKDFASSTPARRLVKRKVSRSPCASLYSRGGIDQRSFESGVWGLNGTIIDMYVSYDVSVNVLHH